MPALQIAWEVVKACYMTLMRDSENLKKALGEDKPSAPPPGATATAAAGAAAAAGAPGTAGPALAVRRAPASKAGFQQVGAPAGSLFMGVCLYFLLQRL